MPTLTIPDKICLHCGGNKWYISPCKYKNVTCVKIISERAKNYYANNKDKVLAVTKAYFKTPEGKAALKRAANNQSARLTDHYILNLIQCRGIQEGILIDRSLVTQEQIKRYRESLKTQRLLKKLKNGKESLKGN